MDEKEKLLQELIEKFEKIKKELKFKANFEEIDEFFFVKDAILEVGYVSDNFERQLCIRMVGTFYSWTGQFIAWLSPGMIDIATYTEIKAFDENDKKIIKYLIKKGMYFLRADKINSFKKDKIAMGKLIDEMVNFKIEFANKINSLLSKAKEQWNKELKEN